jgi:hypothetical protein
MWQVRQVFIMQREMVENAKEMKTDMGRHDT